MYTIFQKMDMNIRNGKNCLSREYLTLIGRVLPDWWNNKGGCGFKNPTHSGFDVGGSIRYTHPKPDPYTYNIINF